MCIVGLSETRWFWCNISIILVVRFSYTKIFFGTFMAPVTLKRSLTGFIHVTINTTESFQSSILPIHAINTEIRLY